MLQHNQQPPTSQNILTASSSSSSSGSSINTMQMPLEQYAINDQYATGLPLLNQHLVNGYYEPVQNDAPYASSNNGNNWKPLTASEIAPPSSIHNGSDKRTPDPNKSLKPKRDRIVFTELQVARLEREFAIHRYIKRDPRKILAEELQLTPKNIKIWFQNRRMKIKVAKKAASKNSRPTAKVSSQSSQHRVIERTTPTIVIPLEYQFRNAENVTSHANPHALTSNPRNIALLPSTSQEGNIQPFAGLPYSTNAYYAGQEQNAPVQNPHPVHQNSEDSIMPSELIAESTSDEMATPNRQSSPLPSWLPEYLESITMEMQPHMQKDPF